MNYIDVAWKTSDPNDPVRLVSELDESGFETRKIEYFADGNIGYADAKTSARGCILGEVLVPPLDQINRDPQFVGVAIDASAFEQLWASRANGPTINSTRTR